jgi:hypothetical protein
MSPFSLPKTALIPLPCKDFLLVLLLFALSPICLANMASPLREGTFSSTAFSSKDMDILKEKISITLQSDLKTARYQIDYHIRNYEAGKQIPMLFHAKDYQGEFKIWVDQKEIALQVLPEEYLTGNSTALEKFSSYFHKDFGQDQPETVVLYWEDGTGYIYSLRDLSYFELDLLPGEHHIRVEYLANAWTDLSDWVKEYSFRYSLSPAQQWKSFGSLEVTVDASALGMPITTNLGQPSAGKLDSIATWQFSSLPASYLTLTYTPKVSDLAKGLIQIGPTGIAIGIALLLAALHFFFLKQHRKKHPQGLFSWVLLLGIFVVPFLILGSYQYAYDLIDGIIGEDASRFHGYSFLVLFLYPLLVPLYGIPLWIADRWLASSIQNPPAR